MNEEILNLAKEIFDYDFEPNTPQAERIERFGRIMYNKAIKDAAKVSETTEQCCGEPCCSDAIRKLEKTK